MLIENEPYYYVIVKERGIEGGRVMEREGGRKDKEREKEV